MAIDGLGIEAAIVKVAGKLRQQALNLRELGMFEDAIEIETLIAFCCPDPMISFHFPGASQPLRS